MLSCTLSLIRMQHSGGNIQRSVKAKNGEVSLRKSCDGLAARPLYTFPPRETPSTIMSKRAVWTSSRVYNSPFITHRTTGWGRSHLYCRTGSLQPRAHRVVATIPRSHATMAALPAFKDMEHKLPAFKRVLNNSDIVASMRQTEIALWDKLAARSNLVEAPTKFSSDGVQFYNLADKDAGIGIQVARGRHIDWVVSTMTAMGAIGGAAMRITAFPNSEIALPQLAIEYAAFGKIVMYINFYPRTDLVMDEEYWERFYEATGTLGYSYNSLYSEVRTDPAFQVYQSASPKIKLVAGQTGMLYLLDQTPECWEKLAGLAHRTLDLWLDFYSAESSKVRSAEESRRLAEYDKVLLTLPRRDPDNARIVALAGEEIVEQILQVSCKEPSAF